MCLKVSSDCLSDREWTVVGVKKDSEMSVGLVQARDHKTAVMKSVSLRIQAYVFKAWSWMGLKGWVGGKEESRVSRVSGLAFSTVT